MKSLIHKGAKLGFLSASALALFLNACLGPAEVGEESDSADAGDGDGDGDGDEGEPSVPDDVGDLAGTRWEGYFEGGVDVTLVFGRDGAGSILYGEDKNLDPPTDPDVGYFCEGDEQSCLVYQLNEGWPYPISDAEVSGRRVEFTVPLADPWEEWCALQTPHVQQENSDGSKNYGVGPNHGGGFNSEGCFIYESVGSSEVEYVDCGWFSLASASVCQCDANECVAASGAVGFDLTANTDFTELSNIDGLHLFLVE